MNPLSVAYRCDGVNISHRPITTSFDGITLEVIGYELPDVTIQVGGGRINMKAGDVLYIESNHFRFPGSLIVGLTADFPGLRCGASYDVEVLNLDRAGSTKIMTCLFITAEEAQS